jgi:hypothetical protein
MSQASQNSSQASPPHAATLRKLFSRLKVIRILSVGVAALGGGLTASATRKNLGGPSIVAAATLTSLAVASAVTAHVLLSLNEQLEEALNQTPKPPNKKPEAEQQKSESQTEEEPQPD